MTDGPDASTRAGEDARREARLSWIAVIATAAFGMLALTDIGAVLLERVRDGRSWLVGEQVLFALVVCGFLSAGLVYPITRLAYYRRLRAHAHASRDALERAYAAAAPSVTVLVPSYGEDTDMLRRTLLSAALQEYPRCRVVLLIDDPPSPRCPNGAAGLLAARNLPREVARMLDEPRELCVTALASFVERLEAHPLDVKLEAQAVCTLHARLASWFARVGKRYPVRDGADRFFVERTIGGRVTHHQTESVRFAWRAEHGQLAIEDIHARYVFLAGAFAVELESFERKLYANLTHEPNKAMNLNAYLGLVGHAYHEVQRDGELLLERRDDGPVRVPRPDYVVTLDAGSIVQPDYVLRLVDVMERDPRVAVAQTPHSAFPDAPGMLERVAGATTDIQFIIHQGFTSFDATFWAGANALLRMRALEDIAEDATERGYPIRRFIHDRTAICDTESSIDLAAKGWTLFNYPERLAYSATPRDFAALSVQRRRWANGGLVIVPKLVRYALSRTGRGKGLAEFAMRLHYLVSITLVNVGLLVCLTYDFGDGMRGAWLALPAVPYYALYARDMGRLGYRLRDLPGVYALSLLLVPVSLSGVYASLRQAIRGQRAPFRRPPKVTSGAAASPGCLAVEYALCLYCIGAAVSELAHGRTAHGVFALANGLLWSYGVCALIGLRASVEELTAWAISLRPRATRTLTIVPPPVNMPPIRPTAPFTTLLHATTPRQRLVSSVAGVALLLSASTSAAHWNDSSQPAVIGAAIREACQGTRG
jgi:cellulose synthase/poly-beta-1,6-N-acetylglucosamine synthase-like glycosyltransferase